MGVKYNWIIRGILYRMIYLKQINVCFKLLIYYEKKYIVWTLPCYNKKNNFSTFLALFLLWFNWQELSHYQIVKNIWAQSLYVNIKSLMGNTCICSEWTVCVCLVRYIKYLLQFLNLEYKIDFHLNNKLQFHWRTGAARSCSHIYFFHPTTF